MNNEGAIVTVVSCECGDWSGMYVNGILEYEGHQIYKRDYIDLIRNHKTFKDVVCFEITDEHLDWLGNSFPYKLEDVNYKGN